MSTPPPLPVDTVMTELQARVRDRLRAELRRHGASDALEDPVVLAGLDDLLRRAVDGARPGALLLPHLLGEPDTWRLRTAISYQSHRGTVGRAIIAVKQRVLMPVLRWLFEYSRDNFERQARVNQVLFACVQELAIENARLRSDVDRLSTK